MWGGNELIIKSITSTCEDLVMICSASNKSTVSFSEQRKNVLIEYFHIVDQFFNSKMKKYIRQFKKKDKLYYLEKEDINHTYIQYKMEQ